jgi:hypothetical protein
VVKLQVENCQQRGRADAPSTRRVAKPEFRPASDYQADRRSALQRELGGSTGEPLSKPASGVRLSLSELDGQNVAVHFTILGRNQSLVGRGHFSRDAALGPILRIEFPDHQEFEITLAEESWNGQIVAESGPNWDFVIRLSC